MLFEVHDESIPLDLLDDHAWSELVACFDSRMWAVARAAGLGAADAADAVQGAWLRLVESVDRIRDPQAIGAWLMTTTRREALRLGRKAGQEFPTDPPDLYEHPTLLTPDPTTEIVDADYGRTLWSRVSRLDEPCRTMLRLFALNPDARYAQVASRMQIPVGSVGPTKIRCSAKLRTLLAEDPLEC
ncbi:RNA polymerase sigma factor [Herbidospora mongoliensis]|uniref:RNA polymerase sigma factor n=1 Tax=Herbidospora mongoliensis TaxID=688067 RepID=UPI000A6238F0|nr:sigma-70 family RNA polymerase sigma factor [Herbidospora mongoliensis]